MRSIRALIFTLVISAFFCAPAEPLPSALISDPPIDHAHPASMAAMVIPSHGEDLNAMMYIAAGGKPHPVVILLDGFPGNERNLDLAQAIRRAGWNVLYFNYRGSWGSPGSFSFTHCTEDTEAAIEFLRDPDTAAELRSDPNRIVLIGHSLGGFLAAFGGAHEPGVTAVGMISAINLGGMVDAQGHSEAAVDRLSEHFARNALEPLSGCTARSLAREIIAHREEWNINSYAALYAHRPVLLITADDGLAGHSRSFANALRREGCSSLTERHFDTDHCYSSSRIEMEAAVLNWLAAISSRS